MGNCKNRYNESIDEKNIAKIEYEKKSKALHIQVIHPMNSDETEKTRAHILKELGFLSEITFRPLTGPKTETNAFEAFMTEYGRIFPYLKGAVAKMEREDLGDNTVRLVVHLKVDNEISRKRITDIVAGRFPGMVFKWHFTRADNSEIASMDEMIAAEIRETVVAGGNQRKGHIKEGTFKYRIKGTPVSIDEALSREESTVLVEGVLFFREEKSLRNGKRLEVFHLTDSHNSMAVKRFLESKEEGLARIAFGEKLRVKGQMRYDKFERENILFAQSVETLPALDVREDHAPEKRIELHCHTNMSSMDGVCSTESLIKRAAEWGHDALAITDHGVVQAYPDAYKYGKKHGVKVIYGIEGYLVNDDIKIIIANQNDEGVLFREGTFVVFDIETTGLSYKNDRITEIGALKMENGEIIDKMSLLINPGKGIPVEIQELTGITDAMVAGSLAFEEAISKISGFFGNHPLVAHNASFDYSFLRSAFERCGRVLDNTVIDTLAFSKLIFPNMNRYNLKALCKTLNINLENHHRALDDALATSEILKIMLDKFGENDLNSLNEEARKKINYKQLDTSHVTIFAKNAKGLRNLYELVSLSHIEYFYKKPRIIKSELAMRRDGLLIGTACESGEFYKAVLEQKTDEELSNIISFYDFAEIQPIANNRFLIERNIVGSENDLQAINRKIIEISESNDKLVVATGDVHFSDPEEAVFREILMSGQGFADSGNQPPLYLKTTDEMMSDFDYLGPEKAKEIVVRNPRAICEMIEEIIPIPLETFAPEIEGSDEQLRKLCYENAERLYGNPLPSILEQRLERELRSIIGNGYAVMYIIAQKLVAKSLKDGYLVGSRGSVGSSLAATMSDITEVNPLPPHYRCRKCKFSEFFTDGVYGSGIDLPDKDCPICATPLEKDGQDIPFEVFLGFEGDKEPDIDLNFAGEYQSVAHKYTEELFGKGKVFRAGTIGTIAAKTAYGFVKKYMEENGRQVTKFEINRLSAGCSGVKRTTGQHPGGIMVVPHYKDIHEFTPIQKPANDRESDIVTTHFDYHAISGRLLKLDILGHDAPSTIKFLEEATGFDPQDILLDDKTTMSLFTGTQALNLVENQDYFDIGSLGIPEFGTKFVRQMLLDTMPTTFAELVRISGLSHGTDVWINNAQELVRTGVAELKDVISTRDDIMNYLIKMGLPNKSAFKIMENVRKGRGLKEDDIELMKRKNVPEWYVDSCNKIKYMFPKAHAAAYVMMSYRIAYFKVHHPLAFYASYFTNKVDDFDAETILKGPSHVRKRMDDLQKDFNELKQKEKDQMTVFEVAYEMYSRGFSFANIDIYKSDPQRFVILQNALLCPLRSLPGLGENAAVSLAEERRKGPFISLEDLRIRTKISNKIIEKLKNNSCMELLPETNQLQMFGLQ